MTFVVVTLVVVIGALLGFIYNQSDRYERLLTKYLELAVTRGDESRQSSVDLTGQLLKSVSDAVQQQVSVIQESVKTAWSPQPSAVDMTPTDLHPKVRELMAKYGMNPNFAHYNLPVPASASPESDDITDPTDAYLNDGRVPYRPSTRMLGETEMMDSDEPFGVPGLKAII